MTLRDSVTNQAAMIRKLLNFPETPQPERSTDHLSSEEQKTSKQTKQKTRHHAQEQAKKR